MELYAIRHGESEANRRGAYAGWAQVGLTDKGREQAALLGRRLKGIAFDAVFSSDLLRTRQTTELVLPGVPYEVSDKLREIHVGILEGRTREEARKEFGEVRRQFWMQYDYTGEGGENEDDVRRRVAAFMEELAAKVLPPGGRQALGNAPCASVTFPGGASAAGPMQTAVFQDQAKIAVICHHGTLAAMLSYVLGCKVERDRVKADNCSVNRFSFREGRWCLRGWNGTGGAR